MCTMLTIIPNASLSRRDYRMCPAIGPPAHVPPRTPEQPDPPCHRHRRLPAIDSKTATSVVALPGPPRIADDSTDTGRADLRAEAVPGASHGANRHAAAVPQLEYSPRYR